MEKLPKFLGIVILALLIFASGVFVGTFTADLREREYDDWAYYGDEYPTYDFDDIENSEMDFYAIVLDVSENKIVVEGTDNGQGKQRFKLDGVFINNEYGEEISPLELEKGMVVHMGFADITYQLVSIDILSPEVYENWTNNQGEPLGAN
ncbi:MAG: hypothetical protein FWG82_02565 [Oscillospiraceae bacterium]|nr:hypothetical protein [Oscillospiraceae bacterium]